MESLNSLMNLYIPFTEAHSSLLQPKLIRLPEMPVCLQCFQAKKIQDLEVGSCI